MSDHEFWTRRQSWEPVSIRKAAAVVAVIALAGSALVVSLWQYAGGPAGDREVSFGGASPHGGAREEGPGFADPPAVTEVETSLLGSSTPAPVPPPAAPAPALAAPNSARVPAAPMPAAPAQSPSAPTSSSSGSTSSAQQTAPAPAPAPPPEEPAPAPALPPVTSPPAPCVVNLLGICVAL